MKLRKVLAVRTQKKDTAAAQLAQAQAMLNEALTRTADIKRLTDEYAEDLVSAQSAYQLKQRLIFLEQMYSVRDEQRAHATSLEQHLEQCQMQFIKARADEKLLTDLLAKREADHAYRQQKKSRRVQVMRPPTKL